MRRGVLVGVAGIAITGAVLAASSRSESEARLVDMPGACENLAAAASAPSIDDTSASHAFASTRPLHELPTGSDVLDRLADSCSESR